MTVKEYLLQAKNTERRIDLLEAKAKKMRESLFGRGVSYDGVSVKGGSAEDILGGTIAKVADYERKTAEKIAELIDLRIEIEDTIKTLKDDEEREVLDRRYLQYQPWESGYDKHTGEYVKGIAEEMHRSERQIYRIHGMALLHLSVNVSECQ